MPQNHVRCSCSVSTHCELLRFAYLLPLLFGPDLCYLNSHKFNAVCHFWLIEIYAHFDIEIIMAMWDFHGAPQNRISTRKLRANYLSRFVVRDFC